MANTIKSGMQEDLSNRDKGQQGEDLACHYLIKNGFNIVCRNFRTPRGEIDIVAQKKQMLHFFEVKTRLGTRFGDPFEALTTVKKRRLRQTAQWFLLKHKEHNKPCLFGVIGVDLSCQPAAVECIIDAFE